MAKLFGGGAQNPYATSAPFQAFANPFAHPPAGGFDRNLFEQDDGRPALGYYATTVNAYGPFRDWLENTATQHQLYTDYQGAYTAKGDPAYSFTDYLGANDPYRKFMSLSQQDRGETPATTLSPFVQLMNL